MRARGAGWTLSLAACILCTISRGARAQQDAEGAVRSTKAGVYTAAQAARGKELYEWKCRECHTTASHTGDVFRNGWNGRLLSELFDYITERMPKNDPGSLAPEEYAEVTAYLLKLNGMPAGDEELPSATAALRKIRIGSKAKEP